MDDCEAITSDCKNRNHSPESVENEIAHEEVEVILKGRNPKPKESAFLSLEELLDHNDNSDATTSTRDPISNYKQIQTQDRAGQIVQIDVGDPICNLKPSTKRSTGVPEIRMSHRTPPTDLVDMRRSYTSTNRKHYRTDVSDENIVGSIIKRQQKKFSNRTNKVTKTQLKTAFDESPSYSLTPSSINYDDAFSKRLFQSTSSANRQISTNTQSFGVNGTYTSVIKEQCTQNGNMNIDRTCLWRDPHKTSRKTQDDVILTQAQKLARATRTSSILNGRHPVSPFMSSKSIWKKDESDTQAFGPTFLNKKKRKNPFEDVNDQADCSGGVHDSNSFKINTPCKANGVVTSPNRRRHSSRIGLNSPYHTPTRSTKKSQGALSRLHQSIRTSIDADKARLQSGIFPVPSDTDKRMDVNDPRNRAETIMDITIVKPKPIPFVNDTSKAFLLGYVHSHTNNYNKIKTIQLPSKGGRSRNFASLRRDDEINSHKDIDNQNITMNTPALAWVCFTHDTLTEISLIQGKQLRVYNAIVLKSENHLDIPVVLGTRLCETFPNELPTLSAVPESYFVEHE